MNSNMVKLNKDKTEFIVDSSKQHVKKIEYFQIKVRMIQLYTLVHVCKKSRDIARYYSKNGAD